jgi:glutathione S-transferase
MTARFGAPEADKRNWSVRMQESGVERALDYVADRLGDHPFLAGDRFTLADIAIGTAFGIWRGALNGALPDKLTAYRDRLTARPAYVRAQAAAAGTPPEATERR